MENGAIAVFDSGIGGLTVLNELTKILPHEKFIYFGDGLNCPYGEKSRQEIQKLTFTNVERLISQGVKLVVIACNTASSVAVQKLREVYTIPFVAMEPAVKPAVLHSKSGVVGVLATKQTIDGIPFKNLCEKWQAKAKIVARCGEGLVDIVEKSLFDSLESQQTIKNHIEFLIAEGADQIVLGCTHFPFLLSAIKRVIGKREVTVIDPAPFVALRVKNLLLEANNLHLKGDNLGEERVAKAEIQFLSCSDANYINFLKQNFEKLQQHEQ